MPYDMKLLLQNYEESVIGKSITIYVRECKNSTENENSCASEEEIDEFIENVFIDTSIITDELDIRSQQLGIRNGARPVFQQQQIINGVRLKKDTFISGKIRLR